MLIFPVLFTSLSNPEAEPDKQEKKRNPKLEMRFSELTEARKAAEAKAEAERVRAEAAERKAAELEARLNPPKTETEAAQLLSRALDPGDYGSRITT